MIVYTKKYYWTTVAHDWADTEEIVAKKCKLELIYMGPGRFGEIIAIENPVPMAPIPAGTRISSRTKNRINYAAMNTGTEENKKEKKTPPKKRKRKSPLPKKEPSAKRIKAQQRLTRQGLNELASPNHRAKLIGTVIVTSPSSSESTPPDHEILREPDIKQEIKIKTEEDLLHLPPNVPRKVVDLKDPAVPLIIRHTDGSVCHSKKSYAFYNKEPPPRPNELPDLPDPLDRAVNTENSASVSAPNSMESELRDLLDLHSPEEAEQHEKQDEPTPDVNTGNNIVNNAPNSIETGQVRKGPQDTPISDVNTERNKVDHGSNITDETLVQTEIVGNASAHEELTNPKNNAEPKTMDTSSATMSINNVSKLQETSTGTDHTPSSVSINEQVALDIADR